MKRSPRGRKTDADPILNAIVRTAARLCEASYCHLYLIDGGFLRNVAKHGSLPHSVAVGGGFPVGRGSVAGRAVHDRRTVHVRDLKVARRQFKNAESVQRASGLRTMLATPLLRDGQAIGALVVLRRVVRPFTAHQIALLKSFAEQATIALENARLSRELEARNRELTEVLGRETATGAILGVISRSPTDIEPVLSAVAESAARLCHAYDATVFRLEGDVLRLVAHHGPVVARSTLPVNRDTVGGRSILEARPIQVPDAQAEASEFPEAAIAAREIGHRTLLSVPLLREGVPIGAIQLRRTEVEPFTNMQIALLQTFADQAVIAIENVRLFTELEARNQDLTDSLTQQTVTAEILRVISSSPTDIQPVLEAITENAARLCDAIDTAIFLEDGEELRLATHLGPIALGPVGQFTVPMVRGTLTGRAALEQRTIQLADHRAEAADYPEGTAVARRLGVHTMLAVPLLHTGKAIGVIALRRTEVRLFTDQQIALLQTFADQAVIAIENVRLFTELGKRNRDLTEALDQQTATSEILRVISQSQTDVQPVFDAIVDNAISLFRAWAVAVMRSDGQLLHLIAARGGVPGTEEYLRRQSPWPIQGPLPASRCVVHRTLIHIPDSESDPTLNQEMRDLARTRGWRSVLAAPMLRDGHPIGAITVTRAEAGPFSSAEVGLLQTFTDQAVIAIENARLLTELRTKNSDLMESLDQQTATSEILRVISRSPTDVQPVFDAIARNARRLCDTSSASVGMLDGTMIRLAVIDNEDAAAAEAFRGAYPSPVMPRSAGGRAILTGRTVHIPDVLEDPDYEFAGLQRVGLRSVLCVPMLRHGAPIGAITVHTWAAARPFGTQQIELLQTFADQAVIAVENARLFRELEERTAELTRSVGQLTALGEISRAVSSTLDVETVLQTVVSRASQLAGSDGGAIYEYDDGTQEFHIRATHNLDPVLVTALRAAPLHRGEGAMGRAAETRQPAQIADIQVGGAYQSHIRDTLLRAGYRALLSVPLLREDQIIGSLSLNRKAPGEFPAEVVEVLKTFATQSALAIQNARLFGEIEVKSRQLEAASQHKSEFLANMSHELRTPLNAIIGFSEVLNERMFGELNEKQDEYLKDIHASGTHLLSLINDILDLSKIEAGRMELELTDFHLPSAIDSALTLVRERATRRGISLQPGVDGGVGQVRADERKVRQVLLNLLSNAIKFTPEGGRIEVRAARENGAVEASVSDTGIGIAPEDQEAVFEEFRQVGSSAARQQGTGLGLTLCRKFIELHGGKIWVTSALGAGSTFTFRLPFRQG